MSQALYYPTTEIHDEDILKTALLMWDKLECIVPFKDDGYWGPDELREAHELIVEPIVPNTKQKTKAHELILELATSPVPERYLLSKDEAGDLAYRIYPQKLFYETFEVLRETRMATLQDDRWYFEDAVGLTVMSILADVCAGSTKRTITDADVAHSALLRSISGIHQGVDCTGEAPEPKLVNIAIDIIDPSSLSLNTLLDFRRREGSTSEGRHIRRLRRKFSEKIDEYATKSVLMVSEGQSEEEISRQFEQDMRDDLADLKEALKMNRNDLFTSRPFVVAVGAAATSLIPAVGMAANAVTAVSLLSASNKYVRGRRQAFEDHAMAWLYKATQPQLSDYLYRIGPIPALV